MLDKVDLLRSIIEEALVDVADKRGVENFVTPDVLLERPKREEQGDWATNVAMQSCKIFGMKPRDLAQELVDIMASNVNIKSVEVAGPGFINFFLADRWMGDTIGQILAQGESFGRANLGEGRMVQVEFVSANPTGPLHVGHGRGAAVGDVTGNILEFAGWKVQKEYYVNDAGLQMSILGRSTQARYFELLGKADAAPFPEDGYKGDYIYDLARDVVEAEGDRFVSMSLEESLPFFQDYATGVILENIKGDLANFGVRFDRWFSEKSLYTDGLVEKAARTLTDNGFTYEHEGATWFRSSDLGDDKDRVLFRSNGVPTYFASDVAYHKNKYDRGFDTVIDVWGADHHGYIPRMSAVVESLGVDRSKFQVLLIQFVNLLRDGQQVAMSTRSGQFVTLRDVVDEVGVDATRYYFVMRRSDSHLDFDLELAKSQSSDNPVFYVQYANARIESILRSAKEKGMDLPDISELDVSVLSSPEEKRLVTKLSLFPEEVERAAVELAPHRIVNYVHGLAGDFHAFYNVGRILGEPEKVRDSRLLLVEAVRIVLRNAMRLLGISAPDRM